MAKGIAHRDWTIYRDDYRDRDGRVDEGAFNAAVQNELALAQHIMWRLGIAIVAAPVSRRAPDGSYYRDAYVFKTATVPAAREAGEPATEIEALEEALADDTLEDDPALVESE